MLQANLFNTDRERERDGGRDGWIDAAGEPVYQRDGWIDRWMDGWMDNCCRRTCLTHKERDGWIDGWMDGWLMQANLFNRERWMDGSIDR